MRSILLARREGPAFFDEDNACAGFDHRCSLLFFKRNDKSDFQYRASRDILIISAEISKNAARAACMQLGRLIKYNEEVRT